MNTLRAKLMALFVGAILAVVVLATFGVVFILDYPQADPLLEQVRVILKVAGKHEALARLEAGGQSGGATAIGLSPAPAAGSIMEGPTQHLNNSLRGHKAPFDALVTQEPTGGHVISLKISDSEWLILPGGPPPPWVPVAGWLLLITVGATGVAMIVVHRMTQPISLIQRTVAGVGPSGEAPLLPETGPLEAQALARAINTLSLRLKSAMESRMRLVAAAGHDLRTPMTRMRLRAEFVDDGDREKWIADIDELEHIAESAISLVREEIEETPKDAVRLDEMVSDVVSELRELQFSARLECARPASVLARPLSLKRALRNLIINAATHGGGATVRVGVDGGSAVVSVEDCGPGIPEPLIQRACEPFFRVDQTRASSMHGAGLGLAIAREIIQRNMGRLELANRPGGGLVQRVELPPHALSGA